MKEKPDQSYAEWHRDCMCRQIEEQDQLARRYTYEYDHYILRGVSALIVFSVVMAFAVIACYVLP